MLRCAGLSEVAQHLAEHGGELEAMAGEACREAHLWMFGMAVDDSVTAMDEQAEPEEPVEQTEEEPATEDEAEAEAQAEADVCTSLMLA